MEKEKGPDGTIGRRNVPTPARSRQMPVWVIVKKERGDDCKDEPVDETKVKAEPADEINEEPVAEIKINEEPVAKINEEPVAINEEPVAKIDEEPVDATEPAAMGGTSDAESSSGRAADDAECDDPSSESSPSESESSDGKMSDDCDAVDVSDQLVAADPSDEVNQIVGDDSDVGDQIVVRAGSGSSAVLNVVDKFKHQVKFPILRALLANALPDGQTNPPSIEFIRVRGPLSVLGQLEEATVAENAVAVASSDDSSAGTSSESGGESEAGSEAGNHSSDDDDDDDDTDIEDAKLVAGRHERSRKAESLETIEAPKTVAVETIESDSESGTTLQLDGTRKPTPAPEVTDRKRGHVQPPAASKKVTLGKKQLIQKALDLAKAAPPSKKMCKKACDDKNK